MAQGEKKFSHIKVSSDEENDFVIEAGERNDASKQGGVGVQEASEKNVAGSISATFDEDAGEEEKAVSPTADENGNVLGQADESEVPDELEELGEPSEPIVPGEPGESTVPDPSSSEKTDGGSYHETTLEDLKSTRMSKMQKAVLAVALLLIVAAVVYYFFFM